MSVPGGEELAFSPSDIGVWEVNRGAHAPPLLLAASVTGTDSDLLANTLRLLYEHDCEKLANTLCTPHILSKCSTMVTRGGAVLPRAERKDNGGSRGWFS